MSLPNFMCIGAAKSGTTTLYDILRQHPDIFIPSYKEPHFFDSPIVFERGVDWYENTYFRNVKNRKCIGDFTPSYLFEAKAPQRILKSLGKDVKFIIILRNPIDRAYSQYLHSVRDEREDLSFQMALKKESKRIKNYQEDTDYLLKLRISYFSQGLYGEMIENYLNIFSKDQFLFILFEEELIRNTRETIRKVLNFLEIDSEFSLNVNIKSNIASKVKYKWVMRFMQKSGFWRSIIRKLIFSLKWRQIIKNKIHRANTSSFTPEPLSKDIRKEMYNNYFLDDIKKLESILGRKMNWQE